MSLFEKMKLQAQQVLEDRQIQAELSQETLALRNAKLKEIFDYWREFSELVKVIQPEFTHPIEIPSIGTMTGLKVVEPFSDYRYKLLNNQTFTDEIDYATIFFFYKAPNAFQFQRELGVATYVKDVLWRYGIVHTVDDVKNEFSRTVEIAFNIPWQIKGSVFVTPLPNSEVLHFSLKNIAKVGELEVEMLFEQVNMEFLDEMSKLMLGQENDFWKLVKF